MNKNLLLSTLICFTLSNLSFSQISPIGSNYTQDRSDLPAVIPPSPTVANLMKFEEVPIDAYTGQPNISIPLYSNSLGNNLNLDVSLKYSTSGVRIDQRSGWTGTGWSLNAGGFISRTVNDIPDEKKVLDDGIGTLHNDYFNFNSFSSAEMDEFIYKAYRDKEHFDTQPDLFQFNFLGYSGRFIIIKSGNDFEAKLLSRDQKINIDIDFSYNNGAISGIDKFTLTDPFGYIYEFEAKETTTSQSTSTIYSRDGNITYLPDINGPYPQTYTSAWGITKVKASNGIELAGFSYNSVVESYKTPSTTTTYQSDILTHSSLFNTPENSSQAVGYNSGITKPKKTTSFQSITVNTKKLSSIALRGGINLTFTNIPEHPEFTDSGTGFSSSCILTELKIKHNNDLIKTYAFDYVTSMHGRLFLEKVTEGNGLGSIETKIYNNNIDQLPSMDNSASYKKDRWGYYNGNNNVSGSLFNLTLDNEVDTEKIKTGLIDSIMYPTSGIKSYIFESNSFSYFGNSRIFDSTIPHNRVVADYIFDTFTGDVYTPPANEFYFYLDVTQNIFVDKQTLFVQANVDLDKHKIFIIPVKTINGVYVNPEGPINPNLFQNDNTRSRRDLEITPPTPSFINERVRLAPGWYKVQVGNIGDYFSSEPNDYSLTVRIIHTKYDYKQSYMFGGGVRIKSIEFKDQGNVEKKISYSYYEDYLTGLNPVSAFISSGSFDGSLARDRNYTLSKKYTFAVGQNPPGPSTMSITYDVTESSQLNNVNTKGTYVGYKNVYRSETGNGYSAYEFTSPIDHPIFPNIYGYPYLPFEDEDYKRGLLVSQKEFNEDGQILKESINDYNYESNDLVEALLVREMSNNCEWEQFYNTYDGYNDTIVDNPPPFWMNTFYNCGSVTSYNPYFSYWYNNGKAFLSETTFIDYFYDENNVQSQTQSRQTYLYNNTNYQIGEQNTYYNEKGIERHLKTKYYYPVGGVPSNYNNSAIIARLNALNKINEVLATERYQDNQLLSQSSNQYHEYETDLVLPESISTSKGGDSLEERITYHRYDTYGNPLEVSKAGGTHISYIWGYNNSFPVAQLIGVTFSEIESQMGNGFHSGASGLTAQNIADLKAAFPSAQISTYKYSPGVGISSMTNARGLTTTYHYDDSNRLEYVKDEDGNILSKNEYNYKN